MKKILYILLITLCVVTVGMFPLDLFVCEVSEWVIYALLAAVVTVTVLIFVKSGARLPGKIISAVLTVAVTLTSIAGIWCDPYFNNLFLRVTDSPMTLPYDTQIPADAAIADLDYAMKYLKKCHPIYLNDSPAAVSEKYEQVKAEIKASGSLTVNELAQKIERVFTVLGDAHTTVGRKYSMPLYLKHYYKWKTGGYALYALNGTTVKELLPLKANLYSFEAESWELESMKNDLLTLQGLDYLGFDISAGVTYTFIDDDGNESNETYYTEDFVTYHDYCVFNNIDIASQDTTFVSYSIDEENSLALLTLDECTYNSEYINCLREMFTEVKAKRIKNVAVDLRANGGGSDWTAVEFIRYLDTDGYLYASETQRLGFFETPQSPNYSINERYSDLTFTGDLYILTSSGSFSSAMLFPQYIKDNKLGTLIGEPPGNDPNGYGEITCFRLPHSGLYTYVSTKHFRRADQNCTDKYVMPDISCDAHNALTELYHTINADQ